MPTQLPRESTDFFGELLYPFAHNISESDAEKPVEDHQFMPAVFGVSVDTIYQRWICRMAVITTFN